MQGLTEMPYRTDIAHQSDVTGLFYCGAVAVLFFFVSILYLKKRERIYLFYTLFLLCSLVYGFINIKSATWMGDLFSGFFSGNRRIIEPVTLLAFSAYIFFAVELVDLRTQSQKVTRIFHIWGIACMLYAITYFVCYPAIVEYSSYIFLAVRVIIFSLSAYFLTWMLIHIQSPVKGPFVLGSLAYFVGAVVASLRFSFNDLPVPWLYNATAPTYFEAGILVETLFFALALGQRFVHLIEEKQLAQERHIEQLDRNRRLINEMNKQLEQKVKEREEEIIWAQDELNKEEQKRLKAEFAIEMAKSEMLARTLQINPHFLFNCLNSITYLIQSGQNKTAIEYLVVFSRFIRLVLETSQKQVIPIFDELTLIEKYLKLEKNRFDDGFSYRINGMENPSLKGIMVPPMLFHPVVENAVWHGLMNSPAKNKEITVDVALSGPVLTITIIDNGVGWESNGHGMVAGKSGERLGLSLTKERIKLYNYSFSDRIDFDINKRSQEGRAGTKATFTITLSPPVTEIN